MASESQHNDVASYAAAVRGELADLPPDERDALLEDLEDHLAEVASEADTPLEARLGTPAAYAAELRLAYGSAHAVARRRFPRLRRWAQTAAGSLAGWQSYQAVRAFLPELRPAWWVLRAYLLVLVAASVLRGPADLRAIPNPFTSRGLLQIIATGVAIILSIKLGRRRARDGGVESWFVRGGNLAVGLAGLVALGTLSTGSTLVVYGGPGPSDPYPAYSSAYANGPLLNIYPYSSDGRPLSDVLLYDQGGRPLELGGKGSGLQNVYPLGADGQPITNEYPLKQMQPDGTLQPAPRVALPPVAATPRPSPSGAAAPSPSATP